MKVAWLCQQEHNLPWLNDLRHELSKHCELVAYGDGLEFIHEFDALKIVEKENPDVIMIGSNQYKFTNLDKVKVPKALKCTDPWANIWRHVQFIKDNNIQLVLMNYNCVTPEYKKYLPERQFGRLPHTINPNVFKNLGLERTIDVVCVAADNYDTYPLRATMYHEFGNPQPFKVYALEPHTLSLDDYVRKINEGKLFALGNVNRIVGNSSMLTFPMSKIYEIMGCETLCMMDTPTEEEELHFIPDYNYIPITRIDYKLKIQQCLNSGNDTKIIARRGLETCLQYHTVEVRTGELKQMLEEISRK